MVPWAQIKLFDGLQIGPLYGHGTYLDCSTLNNCNLTVISGDVWYDRWPGDSNVSQWGDAGSGDVG